MRIVIPSVNYGDLLAVTLRSWESVFSREAITIATAPEDEATQAIAEDHRLRCFVTDAWTRADLTCHVDRAQLRRNAHWDAQNHGPVRFNLALALDEAFGFLTAPPAPGEVCAMVDADIYAFGHVDFASLEDNVIYGCQRYECPDQHILASHLGGTLPLADLVPMHVRGDIERGQHAAVPCVGGGYFQMFRYRPGLRFGSYPAADAYDYDFAHKFPRGAKLESLYVLHLGAESTNWEGRVTPPWEQHT